MKKIKTFTSAILLSGFSFLISAQIVLADLAPTPIGRILDPPNRVDEPVLESSPLFDFISITIGLVVLALIIGSFMIIFKIRKK